MTYLIKIFKSDYCKFVFLLSLIFVFILVPHKIFYRFYTILGILFIVITSLTITCFVWGIKQKINYAKTQGVSFIGLITIILGFGALQACTIGVPACTVSVGAGFFALFFPGVVLGLLGKYSVAIVIISLMIQLLALYFMNCFKREY